jgi:DNA-binding MarR family transcriptional regulator
MDLDGDVPPVLDAETRAAGMPTDHQAELRLWLRLLTCTTLLEGEIRTRLRARFDLTLPRFDLMAQLEKTPDGMTLGELSRRMMVSNGNITGLVERLAEQGLVERTPHPADRRAAFVRLTALGRSSFGEMASVHADWIADLFQELNPQDIRQLMNLLGRMKHSVRARIDHRIDGQKG